MRRGLVLPILLAMLSVSAVAQPAATVPATMMPATMMPATMMDVAPTTLELRSGVAGLFYVTNHGDKPVTVQIQAMDWRQQDGRDLLSPSQTLLVSPPMVRIAPDVRQSVRVMAKGTTQGSRAFRLLVSQLPDAARTQDGVRVLLQFSVPVFVDNDAKAPPDLRWTISRGHLRVTNAASQAVKLEGLRVNGIARGELFYLLPGSARDLGRVTGPIHIRVHDGRTGRDLVADVLP